MTRVAGVDGTPDGWAVVIMDGDRWCIRKANALSEIIDGTPHLDIVAVDVPIGLLTAYEIGGRTCDREARQFLGQPRGSSVFPAPVRCVLAATSYADACASSRHAGPDGRALTRQTFAIVPKIREVDELLQTRPEMRDVIREVHPEVCFRELAGCSMKYSKRKREGRVERRHALLRCLHDLDAIEKTGRERGLPLEDILDAAVACWSARRLALGKGRSLIKCIPHDETGLPMTIWV